MFEALVLEDVAVLLAGFQIVSVVQTPFKTGQGCFAKISGNILVVILNTFLLVPLPAEVAAGHVGQVAPPTISAAALLVANHALLTATVLPSEWVRPTEDPP